MADSSSWPKPYYAVLLYNIRTPSSIEGDSADEYKKIGGQMWQLAKGFPGYLGIESISDTPNRKGVTISYWKDLEIIRQWKDHPDHIIAQQLGRTKFYEKYIIRVMKVEREYSFEAPLAEPLNQISETISSVQPKMETSQLSNKN